MSNASRERYIYNTKKTKTIIVNEQEDSRLTLNGKPIGRSVCVKHLGIYGNNKNSNMDTVLTRIKDARRTAYSLLGAGLCGLNGSGPEVGITIYTTYVLPQLLYGLEALVLNENEIKILEHYHRRNLRHLLHLPVSTSSTAIHLLTGCPPIEAFIHIQTLALLGNIAIGHNQNSPSLFIYNLIRRQLAIKDSTSSSWAASVRRILYKYSLPTAYCLFDQPPSKYIWKKMVTTAVNNYWTEELRTTAKDLSTLRYLDLDQTKLGKLHISLCGATDALSIQKITVSTKILVRRYPLSSNQTAGKRKRPTCPLCNTEEETEKHFILLCPALHQTRISFLPDILQHFREKRLPVDPDLLTKFIIDPVGQNQPMHFIYLVRNLLFALHNNKTRVVASHPSVNTTDTTVSKPVAKLGPQ